MPQDGEGVEKNIKTGPVIQWRNVDGVALSRGAIWPNKTTFTGTIAKEDCTALDTAIPLFRRLP